MLDKVQVLGKVCEAELYKYRVKSLFKFFSSFLN